MPILGHATWHLYRRLVEPSPGERRGASVMPAGGSGAIV
jgi:uncharacterized membrane protein